MTTKVRPIRTKRDYEAAEDFERLWGAKSGMRDGDRLDALVTLIGAYEAEHYPMDPPDPIEAIKFRMESKGSPARPGGNHRHAHPHRRGSERETRFVDRDDPAFARAPGISAGVLIRPSRKRAA